MNLYGCWWITVVLKYDSDKLMSLMVNKKNFPGVK